MISANTTPRNRHSHLVCKNLEWLVTRPSLGRKLILYLVCELPAAAFFFEDQRGLPKEPNGSKIGLGSNLLDDGAKTIR
jgi:hypothetical protein